MSIGLFDSGIGGLSVLKRVVQYLPTQRYIYLADTANLPYGNKTPEQILSYAISKLNWMATMGVNLVSIACNTTDSILNSVDISSYRDKFSHGIAHIITPTVHGIINKYPTIKKIGVLATESTANNQGFEKAFALHSNLEVIVIPCAELVPWIESGMHDYNSGYKLITNYVKKLLDCNIEGFIYGCTHYPFVSHIIKAVLQDNGYNPINIECFDRSNNNDIIMFDPASFTALEIKEKANTFDSEYFVIDCYITEITAKNRLEQAIMQLFGLQPKITLIDLSKQQYVE